MSTTQSHFRSRADSTEYAPYPLEAVVGDPKGEVHWLRDQSGGDGILYAGMFRAEPSEFAYEFAGDETFHMIEGEIEIRLESGEKINLSPGDIASFPKGAKSTWRVVSPMKKFFVISG